MKQFFLILLLNNMLFATTNSQLLGISTQNTISKPVQIPKEEKKSYSKPKEQVLANPAIDRFLGYTKMKKNALKEVSYGLKMDYKLSNKLSLSLDLMAQLEERSYKVKSKEANLLFALAL